VLSISNIIYMIIIFTDHDMAAVKQENDNFIRVSFLFIIYHNIRCSILYFVQ